MTIDPLANMLIQIKNGSVAKKETITVPLSNMKFAVAEVLKRAGFVKDTAKRGKKENRSFEIDLAYTTEGEPKVTGVERISKLSRRVYAGAGEIRNLRRGKPGMMILSTPNGILTASEAKKANVGGEVLFAIW
ncbi:MAG: 30S ribosomal protein S8 [Candidatus Paceibacterota bacterium]